VSKDNNSNGGATAPRMITLSVLAEPRAREVEAKIQTVRRLEAEERAELERLVAVSRQREADDVAAVQDAASELHAHIKAHILAEWREKIDPLVAAFDKYDPASARAIGDQILATESRAKDELGDVVFDTPRHLALAFCRPMVSRDPHAFDALGAAGAWDHGIVGLSLLVPASSAIAAIGGTDDALLEAIRALVLAIEHKAENARRDLLNEYASGRFEAMHLGFDRAEWGMWITQFEQRWTERERQRVIDESRKHLNKIHRARAGDVSAADGEGPGWFERVRNMLGSEGFGPVGPVRHPGTTPEPQ
jgi:hypothetical protein